MIPPRFTILKLAFIIVLAFLTISATSQNRFSDSLALRSIYNDMGGASWSDNTNWLGAGPINTWFGVGFDGTRVITLSLGSNNLVGDVPVEIANMDALQSLDLQNNAIISLPDEIGLPSLISLSLQENQLTAIPVGLQNATSLIFLDVDDNQIISFPNEFFNLSGLTTLRAKSNQISSLPAVINGLISLSQLELDGNQLTTLPNELFDLTSLVSLSVEENLLNTFPSAIANLSNLTILGLGDNELSGNFPSELLLLTSLTDLDLSYNQFSGNIPTGISSLFALTNLNLRENNFDGSIPSSIGSLSILESLSFGNNQLSGNIPTEVGTLSNLREIDLSNNILDGSVPVSFTGLTNLEELFLFDNNLAGLPDLTSLSNLDVFYVSGNLISEIDITANLTVLSDNANQQQFTNATPFNYTVSTGSFGYSTLISPTTVTLQDDSVTSSPIPIGFSFDFFGSSYSSVYISSNGFISFLNPDIDGDGNIDDGADGCCSGDDIPSSIFPNAYIAGYSEDLDPTQGGIIQYENLGSEFVVEFNAVQHLDQPEAVSFQIKLIEGSNNIEIHCLFCTPDNDSEVTTQGIEDELGFQGYSLAGRAASVFDATSDAVLFVPQAPNPAISTSDSLALVALYNATDGVNWTDNTNWLTGTVDTWFGVTVDAGRVINLNLNTNNLNGTIPTEIGDLTELSLLNLAVNQLSGSIPVSIGSLTLLADLNLLANSLSGTIPQEINSLLNLNSIQLQTNLFSGNVPDFSNLTGLTNLALSSNSLSGEIPEYLGSLQDLTQLFLSSNQLTGQIPDTLGTLSNLTFLRLDNNFLVDSIPTSFTSLESLDILLIQNNNLSHLPDLSILTLSNSFDVSNNKFTFEDLEPNQSKITENSGQQNFGLSQILNFLERDNIFLNAQLPGTGINDVYQWQKDGVDIPGETSTTLIKTAEAADVGSYQLSVTNSLFPGIEILSEVITVTVEIPLQTVLPSDSTALVSLYNSTSGTEWVGSTNWLEPGFYVQEWAGITVQNGRVTELDLSGFNVIGNLPAEIGDLDSLESLFAAGNLITGIPSEIGQLSKLQNLHLENNRIEGGIPPEIGNLTNLLNLFLQNNNLSGSIPPEFITLTNLEAFSLSNNNLSGEIPEFIGDLNSLITINLSYNQFTGVLPSSLGDLSSLIELTISDIDSISGTIPAAWTNLTSLETLILNNLSLTGEVPFIPNLITLEVSENKLSSISNSYGTSTTLSFLTLNDNLLESISLGGASNLQFMDVRNNYLTHAEIINNQQAVDYQYEGQKYRYTIQQTGEAVVDGSVTLTVTNNDVVDNQLYWFKNGVNLGVVGEDLIIENLTTEDAGLYECIVTLALDTFQLGIPTNSIAIAIDETDRRYANGVISFTSQYDTLEFSAEQILGLPDRSVVIPASELGYAVVSDDAESSIELSFENPAPINTAWIYGGASIFWMDALNPSSGEYERIFESPGSADVENEVNFPITPYSVGQVKVGVSSNFFSDQDFDGVLDELSIDAIAIGTNAQEINTPNSLFSEVVTDNIINLGWSMSNNNDSVSFIVERSQDGITFVEIATISNGFSGYRDETVPVGDSLYYRVKAFQNGGALESAFSGALTVYKCGGAVSLDILEGSWTGIAEEPNGDGFDPDGGFDPNVSFTRNADGTMTINDFYAGYLDNFGSIPLNGTLSEECDGSLNVEAEIGSTCSSIGIQTVNYIEFFPANDSLVIEYTFDCGNDVRLTFVKNEFESVQAAPSNLNVNVASESEAFLSWVDNSLFEDSWVIERSENGGVYTEIATATPNPQKELQNDTEFETYVDNTVVSGNIYHYRILARNGSGDSEPSNIDSVTVQPTLFSQVTTGEVVNDQPTQSYSGSWADGDGDGDLDLYVTNWYQGQDPSLVTMENYLYLNDGSGEFFKATGTLTEEFVSRGAYPADFDNDGNIDLFVNGQGSSSFIDDTQSFLFSGDGAGQWEANPNFGIASDNVAVADFDNDGFLDIFNPGTFTYKRNNGDRTFESINYNEFLLGADLNDIASSWTNPTPDLNNDGFADLVIAGEGNLDIFINNTDNTMSPILSEEGIGNARGIVFGDFDHDGDLDLIVASRDFSSEEVEKSFYLRNEGDETFTTIDDNSFLGEDIVGQRGLTVLDYDSDGLEDLLWILDNGQPTLFKGNGDGTFSRIPESQENFPLINSFSHPSIADFDDDGDQDIFISNFDASAGVSLFKNNSVANYLRINLEGTQSNKLGIGSQIKVKVNSRWITKQVTVSNGIWSANELTAHFGLGSALQADSVIVNWTSGTQSVLLNVDGNQTIEIMELGIPMIEFDSLALETEEFQPELFGTVNDTSATVEIELQSKFYSATNNKDSTWTLPALTVDSLFNGLYEVIVRATNVVGVGVDTAMLVIDQRAPFVSVDPLISTVRSPEITGFVNDTSAVITLEIDENNYSVSLNTADSTWALAAGQIEPPLADGTYDILVFAENRFGIASDTTTNELRLDATAPEVFVDNIGTSITSPELTGFISDTTATIIINVADRGDFTPVINTSDSTWFIAEGTITPGFTEEDGTILVSATATDSLGNESSDTGEIIITNSIQALAASRITSNSFRANWSAVLDAVSYTFELSDINDFSNIRQSETTTETFFEVEGLDFETEYFYRATFDNGVDAPTTSNVISLTTLITEETLLDFEALLRIEIATGGNDWSTQSNWTEETRKQDWDFITLENERIVEVNIPGNNLTGSFPYESAMTALIEVDISGNALSEIGDLARLSSIQELNVSDNLFEFDDLEKLRNITTFSYSPQRTLYSFNETLNSDSLLVRISNNTSLSIPAKGEYLDYDWFLNGDEIDSNEDFIKGDSLLQILSINYNNMGKFDAIVSNDSLPDLTLEVDSMFVFAVADFSVDVNDEGGELIPDNVDGYLLLTTQGDRGYDTLSITKNQPNSFTFNDVILGDYLISVDSDSGKYVPTYYSESGEAIEWGDAETVEFRKDTAFQVSIVARPRELTEEDGIGTLGVVVEEDFGDDAGRIDARRRAARRKCGLRRKTGGGRTNNNDGFELIAYGETNDNGEFEFGFLPEGVYRFFVEYPGIPLDDASFVEFEVGELGISETDFKLEAFASEDGIEVTIDKVLGVIFDYFKDLEVYPNPTSDVLKISYRHLTNRNVAAQLVDVTGKVFWSKDFRTGYDGYEEIDVSEFETGMYILHVYDRESKNKNVTSYRIMISN